jgi:hypothetical protein
MKSQLLLQKGITVKETDRPGVIRLPRISFGFGIFFFGFNLLYFLPIVFPHALDLSPSLGTLRYFFLAYALILLGAILDSLRQAKTFWQIKPVWTFLAFASVFIMTSRGIMDGEPIASLLQKVFTFSCLLLLPNLGMSQANRRWLWGTLIFHGIFGGLFSLYIYFIKGINTQTELNSAPEWSFLWQGNYAASFLFLCLPVFSGLKGRLSAGISFIADNLKALFLLNRLAWFLVPFQFILLFFINSRKRQTDKSKRSLTRLKILNGLLIFLIMFGIVAFAVAGVFDEFFPIFNTAVTGTIRRLLQYGSVEETIAQNGRWIEAQTAFQSMSGIDWIVGKGLGAQWSSSDLYQGAARQFVHISWASYIFLGGILFLMVMVTPLFWVIRVLLGSPGKVFSLACASYLIVMYIRASSYDIAVANPEWLLFCIVLGMTAASNHTSKDAGLASTRPGDSQ